MGTPLKSLTTTLGTPPGRDERRDRRMVEITKVTKLTLIEHLLYTVSVKALGSERDR